MSVDLTRTLDISGPSARSLFFWPWTTVSHWILKKWKGCLQHLKIRSECLFVSLHHHNLDSTSKWLWAGKGGCHSGNQYRGGWEGLKEGREGLSSIGLWSLQFLPVAPGQEHKAGRQDPWVPAKLLADLQGSPIWVPDRWIHLCSQHEVMLVIMRQIISGTLSSLVESWWVV